MIAAGGVMQVVLPPRGITRLPGRQMARQAYLGRRVTRIRNCAGTKSSRSFTCLHAAQNRHQGQRAHVPSRRISPPDRVGEHGLVKIRSNDVPGSSQARKLGRLIL